MTTAININIQSDDTMRALLADVREELAGRQLDDERALDVLRAVNASLAVRDAIILYAVAPEQVSLQDMTTHATNPNDPELNMRMSLMLTGEFDREPSDEHPTCDALRDFMLRLADLAEGRDKAQPLAVAAYVSWWNGDIETALTCTTAALESDERTNLALIVLTALTKGIMRG